MKTAFGLTGSFRNGPTHVRHTAVDVPDAGKLPDNFQAGLFTDSLRLVPRRPGARAALRLEWSNEPTEGAVNRLRLTQRQMYGRANFDLLRQRVLLAV